MFTVTPRVSGTDSILLMPLDAYVAATPNSTFFGSTSTSDQVDLFDENENPGSTKPICGKSLMNTGVRSTTNAPDGLTVRIGKLNSTLSVYAILTALSVGLFLSAVNRTFRR